MGVTITTADDFIPATHVLGNGKVTQTADGLAGDVAVIGYFGPTSGDGSIGTELRTYTSYRELTENLTKPAANTEDYEALEYLTKQTSDSLGVTSITIAPISAPVNATGFTLTEFTRVLSLLADESFDILVIPTPLKKLTEGTDADVLITTLKTWLSTRFTNQNGVGTIFSLATTDGDAGARVKDMGQGVYGVVIQKFNGWTLQQSTAYYAGQLAGRKVNRSTTAKVILGIESLDTEYTFNTDDAGYTLIKNGVTVFSCKSRKKKEFKVVRAYTPAGYDISEERSADYMTRAFALADFLGDSSNTVTLDSIKGEVTSKMYTFTDKDKLNLCEKINASINKVTATKVQIDLEYIFEGPIINITLLIDIVEE